MIVLKKYVLTTLVSGVSTTIMPEKKVLGIGNQDREDSFSVYYRSLFKPLNSE